MKNLRFNSSFGRSDALRAGNCFLINISIYIFDPPLDILF
jgi:hypothetical protein